MKEGWKLIAFPLCIEKINTTTKLQSSCYGEFGAYPIVSQEKELISGYWDKHEDLFCHKTPVTIFGDHTMVVKYVDFDFVIGADGVKILQPKPFLNPKYFYYWVSSTKIVSHGYARHFRYLKEKEVPYPSLSEQQRIVGILDAEFEKIDALKANAEQNLQNAKDLFQAALNLYFTDRKYKSSILGKECDFVRGPFGGSLKKNCFVDAGYPVYEQQHAIYNRFVFRYYVNEKKYLEMKRFTVNGGDLIMSCSGTIGKVAIVPMDAPKGIINQALLKLTPKTNLIPEYLLWYMNSISFTKQIQEHSQGAAIKNVASVAILKQISLPLPSVNEQREIIQHLNELSNKCKVLQNNYTQTIALCDDLKQALLRKAFSGEL